MNEPWEELRHWRRERGLTQDQLAERLGVGRGVISLLESGDRQYTRKWLEALSSALGVPPSSLVPNTVSRVEITPEVSAMLGKIFKGIG